MQAHAEKERQVGMDESSNSILGSSFRDKRQPVMSTVKITKDNLIGGSARRLHYRVNLQTVVSASVGLVCIGGSDGGGLDGW